MKSKESRHDSHRYSEEKSFREEEALKDRDSHRSRKELEVPESHKNKDRERGIGREREVSRGKEDKISSRDKDRDGHRGRDEKQSGRERDGDGHRVVDDREIIREREASKRRDERESAREREHHKSKTARETGRDREESNSKDEKDHKWRDEKDQKTKDEKDRSRRDEKYKEPLKERERRWNRDEKVIGKEEKNKERDSNKDREETTIRDDRGRLTSKETDGKKLKLENELGLTDEQLRVSTEGRSREDRKSGKESRIDNEIHVRESRHKRKEIDSEEKRDRGEKQRREADSDLERSAATDKKDRGEKRKRGSFQEGNENETSMSMVHEMGQSNKKHETQPGLISPLNHHIPSTFINGSLLSSTKAVLLDANKLALGPGDDNSIDPTRTTFTGSSVGFVTSGEGINDVEDEAKQVIGKSCSDGHTVQPVNGPYLNTPDVLEKAKRALQVQKRLNEKLKKLPQVGKFGAQAVVQSPSVEEYLSSTVAFSTGVESSDATVSGPEQIQSQGFPSFQSTQAFPVGADTGFIPGMVPGLPGVVPGVAPVSSYEAFKRVQELAARLGAQQLPEAFPFLAGISGQIADDVGSTGQQKTVKAPVLRLDAHGREIDEHGHVVDKPKYTSLSTLKVNINKQKKEAFQILRPDLEEDSFNNPHFDPRMGIDKKKILRPKRSSFLFVEEGRWSKQAELLRLKSQFGEAQAKEIKAKQAALAKAKAEADINPNLIEVSERLPIKEEKPKDPIPDVEWWDAMLLPSGSYKDIAEGELKIKMEKLTIYVEHPVPIEPPAEPLPPPPQPLKLTRKEQKKLRTQRRLAKEKDRQEMIRQGLIDPPKPKVKMSNLMKVLGAEATQDPTKLEMEIRTAAAEATQDPTKLEMEIRTAAAEREQAHTDRNLARKLTPAERQEKKERKLFDDPNTLETIVSVYRVNDLSHPQTRFKVDINAQENRLTGCVVMCDEMSVVIVEGGSKSIKRYGKLMLRRINWVTAVKEEDEGDAKGSCRTNQCVLVWQGSVGKPSFDKFLIQQCRTEAAARKYLADAGVGHYWDLAANFTRD
eukprot:c23111_g1_i1 orf=19-3165(+)